MSISEPQIRAEDVQAGSPTALGGKTMRSGRREWIHMAKSAWALWRTKIGAIIFFAILTIAVFGPAMSPYSPTEFVGVPFQTPSGVAKLGTDNLGRDVLSRVLYGGRTVFTLSLIATGLGLLLGIVLGVLAAYSSRIVDELVMRSLDVFMAFPNLLFVLLVVAALGPRVSVLTLAVAIGHAPRVARVARGATLEVAGKDFVLASEALGVPKWRIMLADLFPNITSPMLVEAALRLAFSIATIAALSFLGFGLQPPAADWGLMINENRMGIVVQPYAVVVPVFLIALLTVAVSLVADGFARALIGIDRKTGVT